MKKNDLMVERKMKILENKKLNGLELYFNEKPESQIIAALKQNGFRWHNLKKCWYSKINDKITQFVNNLSNGIIVETVTEQPTTKKNATAPEYKKLLSDYLTMEELKQKIHEWATIQSNKEIWGHKEPYENYIEYLNCYIKAYGKNEYYNKLDYVREAIIHKSFNKNYNTLNCNGSPFAYFAIWEKLPTIEGLKTTNTWYSSMWGYDQTNVDVAWLLNKKLWGLDILIEEQEGSYLIKKIKADSFNDGCRHFRIGRGNPENVRKYDASVTGQYR